MAEADRKHLSFGKIGAREHRALQLRAGQQGLPEIHARKLHGAQVLIAQIRDLTARIPAQVGLVLGDNLA